MSYGPNFSDQFRRAAEYVDRILRGAKPAELAVRQPTKFELVINLTTAKALGLTIPPLLLIIADELLEMTNPHECLLRCMSPVLARTRHVNEQHQCRMIGVKQTLISRCERAPDAACKMKIRIDAKYWRARRDSNPRPPRFVDCCGSLFLQGFFAKCRSSSLLGGQRVIASIAK
jgi:hypothetical protein